MKKASHTAILAGKGDELGVIPASMAASVD